MRCPVLMGVAALSLLLGAASCAKETVESADDGKNQLDFRPTVGKSTLTRATEFTAWEAGDELSVYAYKSGSTDAAYPDSQPIELSYDGSVWTPDAPVTSLGTTVRYYSLYNDGDTTPNGSATADSYSFDYAVVTTAADQRDLIAAQSATAGSLVALQFRHILSQINFAVVQTPGMEIAIDKIELANISSQGTFGMGATSGWSALETPETYEYPLTGVTGIPTDGVATGSLSLKGDDNALMLIPHSFDAASEAELRVTFDLVQDGDKEVATDETATIMLKDCNITEWAEGKRYVYEFDFSTYVTAGEITFTVAVADWEDADPVINTIEIAAPNQESVDNAIAILSEVNTADTDLTRFTVSIPEEVVAPIYITGIPGFDAGDVIYVEFESTASLSNCFTSLDEANWTTDTNDRVLILTCVAPIGIAPEVAAVVAEPGDKAAVEAGINAAIETQAAANTEDDTLTLFPITVAVDLTSETWDVIIPDGFDSGDRIRIEFTGASGIDTAAQIGTVTAGWTKPILQTGNVVLLTKE